MRGEETWYGNWKNGMMEREGEGRGRDEWLD
jgi:hypothetical protein